LPTARPLVELTGDTRAITVPIDSARAGEATLETRACAAGGPDSSAANTDLDGGDGGDGGNHGDLAFSTLCTNSSFLICDSFENGFGSWTVHDDPPRGFLSIDPSLAKSGYMSVRAEIDDSAADYVQAVMTLARPVRPTHIRMFWFLPSATPAIELLRFAGSAPPYGTLVLTADRPVLSVYASALNRPLNVSSTTSLPRDRWACIELSLDDGTGGSTGELRVWVDDVELTDLHQTGLAVSALDQLALGPTLQLTAGTVPFAVFIDEVALDHAHIGCAN